MPAKAKSDAVNYTPTRVIDKGSFGVVFEARVDGE